MIYVIIIYWNYSDDDDENWQPKLFHKIKHGQFDKHRLQKLTPEGKDIVSYIYSIYIVSIL